MDFWERLWTGLQRWECLVSQPWCLIFIEQISNDGISGVPATRVTNISNILRMLRNVCVLSTLLYKKISEFIAYFNFKDVCFSCWVSCVILIFQIKWDEIRLHWFNVIFMRRKLLINILHYGKLLSTNSILL
jgi:hypothetical protein